MPERRGAKQKVKLIIFVEITVKSPGHRSHVDHIVESEDAVGSHDTVDTVRHAIGPFCNAQRVGGRFLIQLAGFVGGIGHEDEAEFFNGFHKSRHNILEMVSRGHL